MIPFRLLLLFWLFTVVGLSTAEATAPPPKWRPRTRLDFVLLEWEKANDTVKAATYRFKRTDHDHTFGTKTSTTGDVRLLKPGWLRVEFHGRTPEFLLYTPKHLHYFRGDFKEENVYPRPEIRPFLGDPKGTADFFSRPANLTG